MNQDRANQLNSAASRCWLFKSGVNIKLQPAHLDIVADTPIATLSTATDFVRAENAAALPVVGQPNTRLIRCTVAAEELPALQEWAQRMRGER